MQAKSRFSLPVIITAAVLVVVLVLSVVLSVINIRPLSAFDGYEYAEVFSAQAESGKLVRSDSEFKRYDKLQNGLTATRFSMMHALLEGKWDSSFRFERDEDDEKVKVDRNSIFSYNFGAGERQILFSYNQPKTVKVEGETIKFDRVRIVFVDSRGEIGRVTIYAYIHDDFVGTSRPQDGVDPYEDAVANPFTTVSITTPLYNAIGDILDTF